MSGYSGTPLPRKLGIGAGMTVAVLDAPAGFETMLGELPDGARIRTPARGKPDVVVAFMTEHRRLSSRLPLLGRAVFPAGGLWIAWPKRSSGVETDITEDVVRELALPLGLVDNKVCAIDETWSGLRLVWRLERR